MLWRSHNHEEKTQFLKTVAVLHGGGWGPLYVLWVIALQEWEIPPFSQMHYNIFNPPISILSSIPTYNSKFILSSLNQ